MKQENDNEQIAQLRRTIEAQANEIVTLKAAALSQEHANSAISREFLTRCLASMRQAVEFGETGRGRPPSQTCMFEIEELESYLAGSESAVTALPADAVKLMKLASDEFHADGVSIHEKGASTDVAEWAQLVARLFGLYPKASLIGGESISESDNKLRLVVGNVLSYAEKGIYKPETALSKLRRSLDDLGQAYAFKPAQKPAPVSDVAIEALREIKTIYGSMASVIATEALDKIEASARDSANQEPPKPYAYEYGKSNGDGTYSVVIDRGDMVKVNATTYVSSPPKNHYKEWPIKPLYLGSPIEASLALDYRAQGREEALAIILAQCSENPFSSCIGWSQSGAPDDEGGTYWDEDKLRQLLHIGDRKHDAYDRAEAAYWDALGRADEAKREMLLVERAPFYKPLHDFLSKHEAWDLLHDLKSGSTKNDDKDGAL